MQELYENTLSHNQYLINQGYNMVEKWECELQCELKKNSEMKDFFNSLNLQEPLEPRHGLFGGRTNATRLHYEAKEGEKIKYVDFTR